MTIMLGAELGEYGNQLTASAGTQECADQIVQIAGRILHILLMSQGTARPASVTEWLCLVCSCCHHIATAELIPVGMKSQTSFEDPNEGDYRLV